jgi:hypothetical protein
MKKIILVSGAGNSGKTTSIRMFLDENGIFRKRIGDTTAIVPIIVRKKPYVMGVATGGDSLPIVEKNFKFFTPRSCDFVVCASKSEGATIEFIKQYAASNKIQLVTIKTMRDKVKAAKDNARVVKEIKQNIP